MPNGVVLCDRLERLITLSKRHRLLGARFMVLSETLEHEAIRRWLRERLGAEEMPYAALSRARRQAFQPRYIEFIGRFNRTHRSPCWLAMPLTAKSMLSTGLCRNTFHFLLIVELLRASDRPLIVITHDRALADQVVSWARAQPRWVCNAVCGPSALKRLIKRFTPLAVLAAIAQTSIAWVFSRRFRLKGNRWRDATLLVTTFPNSSLQPSSYREAYFGSLPSALTQRGQRVVLVALYAERALAHVLALRRVSHGPPVIPQEAYLTGMDLVACGVRALIQWITRVPSHEPVQIDGLNVDVLVEQEIVESCQSRSLFWHLCIAAAARRLGQRLAPARCLYPFENRAWEKMFLIGLRDTSPQTKTIGYQHTVFTFAHTNLFFGEGEASLTPLPNRILTAGEVTKQRLERQGRYPDGLLRLGCALYQRDPLQHGLSRPARLTNLLVALSNDREEYVRLLRFLREALAEPHEYHVRLRPSPGLSIRLLEEALAIVGSSVADCYEVSRTSLTEDLRWAHVVLYASSAVALTALGHGIPVVFVDVGKFLDPDPCLGVHDLTWSVEEPSALRPALCQIAALPEELFELHQRRALAHVERYWPLPTQARLQAFVDALAGAAAPSRALRAASRYLVKDGILRMAQGGAASPGVTARTSTRYGHLWRRSGRHMLAREESGYHFERLTASLSLPPPHGLVLDAGCGEGIDLANQARRPGLEIIGVELSEGGCQASAERTRGLASASVVQGDLQRLPFADGTFNFIYSYGVLHHLPEPAEGLQELVRVLKPGSRLAVYLYEDFSDRGAAWRGLLRLVNGLRPLTTRMPPLLLEVLCRAASPAVFLACGVPSRLARRIPGGSRFADVMPFRHAQGPWSLWGDLYDRFATPIERRYSRADAVSLFREAGLQDVTIAKDRGWMVAGNKPLPHDESALVPIESRNEGAMDGD